MALLTAPPTAFAVGCSGRIDDRAHLADAASSSSGSASGGTASSGSGGPAPSGSGGTSGGSGGPRTGGSTCSATATTPLIDDQSSLKGVAITFNPTFSPSGCGSVGTWFDYSDASGGTITPQPAGPFVFSPEPAGLGSAGIDGSTGGARAACIAGTTGAKQYSTEGLGLNLAMVANPDGGHAMPVPTDASRFSGIEFWVWGGGATAQTLILNAFDRNETPGVGPPGASSGTGTYCDPSGTVTACGGATNVVSVHSGWEVVQVPFATLAVNPYYGGANETELDRTGLTQIHWQVQEIAADASAGTPFDFCVADVSFY